MNGTRGVALLDGRVGRGEVFARPRFVAHAPDDDGRMVLVPFHRGQVAVHRSLFPFLAMRERAFTVAVAVGFHVGLVHEIQSVDIAKIIPVVVLGIVGIAHTVAMGALQFEDIQFLRFRRHVMPVHRVRLVAVRAFQFNFLAVQIIASVLDLAHAEAKQGRNEFSSVPQHDLVAVGLLRAPKPRLLDHEAFFFAAVNQLVVEGVQINRHVRVAIDLNAPVAGKLPFLNGRGGHEEIADPLFRPAQQPGGAENSRKPEHVLVLEIAAVRIAVHFQRDHVAARAHERSDVEFRRRAAVLGKADVFAVHPKIEETIHAVEFKKNIFFFPSPGQIEVAAVAADGIAGGVIGVLFGRFPHDTRSARLVHCEGIAYVRVERRSPAAFPVGAHGLPGAGHLDHGPLGNIVFRLEKILGPGIRILGPVEPPIAVGIQA